MQSSINPSESVAIPLAPLVAAAHSPSFLQQEQSYSTATAQLRLLGYELSEVYAQHKAKLEQHELAQPTELDRKYAITAPQTWAMHFEDKTAQQPKGFVPVLGTSTLRAGGQFLLTSGQRAKLRGYGLTPTRVVECLSLDFYPATRCVRSLVLRSCLHVEEHKRKHVLAQVCINDFGAFMQASADLEQEAETVREEKASAEGKQTSKQLSAAIAAQYI